MNKYLIFICLLIAPVAWAVPPVTTLGASVRSGLDVLNNTLKSQSTNKIERTSGFTPGANITNPS
ncbi:MAG TPA: hypothetical protein VI522_06815, partial [Gammaproteobacteria bacterium]|nr:hypothetical protein [Gammaproteobacteria bacterium]